MSGRIGKVVLVGAGPGAADLITVRGERAVREAEVLVYDSLVSEALLALAPRDAERINVGRRGHGAPTRSQEAVSALLVGKARAGFRVVRLKGGDPFVFGRGGEEVTACLEAGVPVEVVPGVSAAVAAPAAAGIPVTDRRYAASFAVVTGHKDPTRPRENIDWKGLAHSVDTLVILMGMRNLEEIVERVLSGGRAPDTPAAAVMNGTLADQRVVSAPLAALPERVRAAGLQAPAAVVVGDVVRLAWSRERAAEGPLSGWRVVVTRAAEQAAAWADALAEAGAQPVRIPMISVEPLPASPEIDAALAALPETDVLVFTSVNGVRAFAARAEERDAPLSRFRGRVVCVGPSTAQAAGEAGLPVHLLPNRFDAEATLAAIREVLPVAGRRFLLPGAAQAREALVEGLHRAGGQVDALAVYRTVPAALDEAALRGRLGRGELQALTFASPSAVRRFASALDEEARAACRRAVVVAIGPVTAAALREAGLAPDVVAERAEAHAVVEALVRARAQRGGSP